MRPTYKYLLIFILLICSFGLGVYSFKNSNFHKQSEFPLQHATYLHDQNVTIPTFNLTDHQGQTFTTESIRDKWTFWFFGFTHCPDICPITLGTLTAATSNLHAEHAIDDISIVFVSVDPERDQPDQLKTYVTAFGKSIIGVTSDQQNLQPFLKNMGVVAVKQKSVESQSDYLIDHSSAVFLIAPDTGISALFSSPHTAAGITKDFLAIKNKFETNE